MKPYTEWIKPILGGALMIVLSLGALVAFVGILIWGVFTYKDYRRAHEYQDVGKIEQITGVRFPKFRVLEVNKGEGGFNRDYRDSFTFEFGEELPETTWLLLDSLSTDGGSNWHREGNSYSFSVVWGNGLPAPNGERMTGDGFFNISLVKGEKVGRISYGTW